MKFAYRGEFFIHYRENTMELANIRYITLDKKPLFEDGCTRIPTYEEAKTLQPVIVDDLFCLNKDQDNVDRYQSYIDKKFLVVPVRRKTARTTERTNAFPARVLLEITSKCNLACTMCPRNALTRPKLHMSKELVLRCIDELDSVGIEGLWLYNLGEALLHPSIVEILDYCSTTKGLGSVSISNNGQYIPDQAIDALINSNLTFINYSLNSMSAESYALVSPSASYEQLVKNLEKLYQRKNELGKIGSPPWLRVQMIDQPQVVSEIDLFLKQYAPRSEMVSINLLEAFSQEVSQNVSYAKERERTSKKICKRVQRGDCFIFSNGEVSFCDTDFNGKQSLGNVSSSSIQDVWSKFGNIQKLNEEGRIDELPLCKTCLDWDL